ncbi:MAG: hypothetical protein OWU33_13105 [Firmicutes bacterium]|nr:hypothetical protein [Bacillota bacterium]
MKPAASAPWHNAARLSSSPRCPPTGCPRRNSWPRTNGQVPVERHFPCLKDPLFVDALSVKKPERLEAPGYVLRGACLLYSLAERRLGRSGIPIPSPSRRVLTRPTGHELIRHLQSGHIARDAATGARVIALPTIYHPTF